MKTVSFIAQKGGTSKTTCAINLAVEAVANGLKVVLVDLDPQVSASNWSDLRENEEPAVVAPQVPHLPRVLAQVEANGADLVVIDTAGRTNEAALAAAKAADLVFIPMQPSLPDLQTVKATLDLIRLAGKPAVEAVLTRVKASGSSHETAAEWLRGNGVAVSSATIGERVVYQHAYARGLGVGEVEPNGKAHQEIARLYMATCQHVGLPTGRKVKA